MQSGVHENKLWLKPEANNEINRLKLYAPGKEVKVFSTSNDGLRLAQNLKSEFATVRNTILWETELPQIQEYKLAEDFQLNGFKPLPWQVEGVEFCMTYKGGLLRWATGTGKTFAALATISLIPGKHLVIAPKKTLASWIGAFKKFMPNKMVVVIDSMSIEERANYLRLINYIPEVILVANYETFRLYNNAGRKRKGAQELPSEDEEILENGKKEKPVNPTILAIEESGIKFQSCWLDESAQIKNTATSLYRGLSRIHSSFERRYCMSAAPAPQTPADYIGQVAITTHPVFTGYNTADTWLTDNTIRDAYTKKVTGYRNLGILHHTVDTVCHTITLDDPRIQAYLPEQVYIKKFVGMSAKQQEAYNALSAEFVDDVQSLLGNSDFGTEEFLQALAEAEGADDQLEKVNEAMEKLKAAANKYSGASVIIKGILAKIQRLIQCTGGWLCGAIDVEKVNAAKARNPFFDLDELEPAQKALYFLPPAPFEENPKMDLLRELAQNDLASSQFIVLAKYIHEVDAIKVALEECGKRVGTVKGGLSTDKLVNLIQEFDDKKVDVLVLQSESGRYGLNLQVANYTVFYSNSYSYNSRIQAEGRTRRVGSKHEKCFIYDLLCEKTIDELVLHVLRKRESLSNLIMKNPRLVEVHEYLEFNEE